MLRASHVSPDPRVERAARVAAARGWDVEVLAWDRTGDLEPVTVLPFGRVVRYARPAEHGRGLANLLGLVLFQAYLALGTVRRRKGLVAIHACDLSTGLTGLVLARLLRVPLVYDVFDYYADSFPVPRRLRGAVRRLETLVIEAADEVVLPSAGRQRQIAPAQPRSLTIVENSPDIDATAAGEPLPRCDLGYVGILAPGRLLEEVVDLVAAHGSISLRIAGFGPLADHVAAVAEAAPNVEYLGQVGVDEAVRVLRSSTVMFATYDPTVPNHRYSAPNKFAEALALGKPLVVCRDTAIDVLVESSGLGRVIDYDGHQLLAAVEELLADREMLERCAVEGPALYRSSHSWAVNAERLDALYGRLRRPGRRPGRRRP